MQRNENRQNRIRSEESRKRRSFYRTLFIVMAVLVLLLDVIFFILPDKAESEVENRTLQMFPKLNFTTLTNGKFESLFDNYVADQFPARNAWVRMKSTVDRFAGKTENRGIYLAKDGYLIQDLTLPNEEDYTAKMEEIRGFVSAHPGVSFNALIAPTALSILKDHLPQSAPVTDEDAFFEQVKNDFSGMGVHFIDTREAIKAAAKEDQVYFRTDHHWTTFGAYQAYLQMAEELKLPGKDTVYSRNLITDSFSGTLTASSGFRVRETDPIYVYLPDPEQDYSVFYVEEGIRASSFYVSENLDVKDQYTVFFNGNHPQVKIESSNSSEKTLLVIKDSYANCFVPFLAGDYKTIIMVDPRYYTGDLNALMESEGVTDVLYLYNISTFVE